MSIYIIWHAGLQGVFSRNYPEMEVEPALLSSICTGKKKLNPAVLMLRLAGALGIMYFKVPWSSATCGKLAGVQVYPFSWIRAQPDSPGAVGETDSNSWFIKHLENCFAYIWPISWCLSPWGVLVTERASKYRPCMRTPTFSLNYPQTVQWGWQTSLTINAEQHVLENNLSWNKRLHYICLGKETRTNVSLGYVSCVAWHFGTGHLDFMVIGAK